MDPISIGRSNMNEAIDNVNKRPIELPVEFIISCTNNFDKERELGHGSFCAVYKGMDDNRYFAVKCLRFNLAFLEDQKKGIIIQKGVVTKNLEQIRYAETIMTGIKVILNNPLQFYSDNTFIIPVDINQ